MHISKPTILRDQASSPRAVVIHAVNTSANLAAMMDPILFPVTALGAPFWAAIGLAHKGVPGIETLEPRAVGVVVRPSLVGPTFDIMRPVRPVRLFHPLSVCRPLSVDRSWAEGNDARIEVRIVEGSCIGGYHQEEEDEVKNKDSNAGSMFV